MEFKRERVLEKFAFLNETVQKKFGYRSGSVKKFDYRSGSVLTNQNSYLGSDAFTNQESKILHTESLNSMLILDDYGK